MDRVEPELTEKVKAENTVNVVRIEKVTDVVEEPVDFAVITKKDDSLSKERKLSKKEKMDSFPRNMKLLKKMAKRSKRITFRKSS